VLVAGGHPPWWSSWLSWASKNLTPFKTAS
jgi:hypothetical protein